MNDMETIETPSQNNQESDSKKMTVSNQNPYAKSVKTNICKGFIAEGFIRTICGNTYIGMFMHETNILHHSCFCIYFSCIFGLLVTLSDFR
jgi:hypothetical protein